MASIGNTEVKAAGDIYHITGGLKGRKAVALLGGAV